MSSIKISVFTPTYNRAFIIHKVFESLQQQTYKNFEWIVVDDGSSDNTENIIMNFKRIANFEIIYKKQENKGKHIAINTGVSLASGNAFSIVDSDDYVTNDYIETITYYFTKIKANNSIGGISFPRGTESGESHVKNFTQKELICNSFELNYKYNISGEQCFIIKIDIIKKYPFPEFKGEKYCPESLIWKRMALKYDFYFINKTIVIGSYLEDGLTSNYWENMKKSPQTATLYFSEMSNYKMVPKNVKIYALENYWRFSSANTSLSFLEKIRKVPFWLSIYVLTMKKLKYWKGSKQFIKK